MKSWLFSTIQSVLSVRSLQTIPTVPKNTKKVYLDCFSLVSHTQIFRKAPYGKCVHRFCSLFWLPILKIMIDVFYRTENKLAYISQNEILWGISSLFRLCKINAMLSSVFCKINIKNINKKLITKNCPNHSGEMETKSGTGMFWTDRMVWMVEKCPPENKYH